MKLESLTLNGTTYDSFPDKDAVKTVNSKTPDANGNVAISASDVGALPNTYTPPDQTAEQVGADPKGAAQNAVAEHNIDQDSHNDIRLELKAINDRLTAFFDSDDQTLDELSEIVAYITSNKTLIEAITDSKVSVLDIVNNLTTNVANKPLSAAQGVALKALIDAITIPTKLSQLTNDKGYITGYTETDPTVPAWAKAEKKPTYTAEEVGALSANSLPGAVNDALAQAKASGEFKGDPGDSPVKGVDYWTEADKNEIKSYVDEAILGGAW